MTPLFILVLTLAGRYLPVIAQNPDTIGQATISQITEHYPNGQIQITGTYKNKKREGHFTAFYPDGKVSATATFANGKQISDTTFNEDGSINPDIIDFFRDSEFSGGTHGWLDFINKHVHYPASSFNKGIEGTVVVYFMVDEHGKISELKINQSVEPKIDAAAMRVIRKSSGQWYPAIYGGRYVKSYKKQSIVFGSSGRYFIQSTSTSNRCKGLSTDNGFVSTAQFPVCQKFIPLCADAIIPVSRHWKQIIIYFTPLNIL